jgi:AraC-like DNA-binding protein
MTLDDPADQGWKRTAAALVDNPFDRFELPGDAFGWVYRYHNPEPLPIAPITTSSLEIAVQLEGAWEVAVQGEAPRRFGPGDVFVVEPLVRHRYAFSADGGPGRQVGFALPAVVDGRRLALAAPGERWRRRLVELAREVAAGRRDQAPAALAELVRDLGAPAQDDPVERGRVLLSATSDRPLYLEHVAEEVGLHPKTLSRRFLQRVGVAPIRFRTELRLQRAIRLLWSRPELAVARVAEEVGFADPRLLHRLAVATFRMTPAQLGRRSVARST